MDGLIPRIAVGVAGLLTIAILLLAVFNDHGMLSVNEHQRQLDELQDSNEDLQKQNDQLFEEIQQYRHDPAAIEKKAREELKLVKPDEIIIETPGDTTPAKQ